MRLVAQTAFNTTLGNKLWTRVSTMLETVIFDDVGKELTLYCIAKRVDAIGPNHVTWRELNRTIHWRDNILRL